MPRLMSFMLTTQQFRDQTKTVTRRLGWKHLKAGDIVVGCEQCQGLRKGQTITKLGPIQVVSTRWQMLRAITLDEVIREGFPDMTPAQFVEFFCQTHRCEPDRPVNRIEFRYLTSEVLAYILTASQLKLLASLRSAFSSEWFPEADAVKLLGATHHPWSRPLYYKGCLDRRLRTNGLEYRLMV